LLLLSTVDYFNLSVFLLGGDQVTILMRE